MITAETARQMTDDAVFDAFFAALFAANVARPDAAQYWAHGAGLDAEPNAADAALLAAEGESALLLDELERRGLDHLLHC